MVRRWSSTVPILALLLGSLAVACMQKKQDAEVAASAPAPAPAAAPASRAPASPPSPAAAPAPAAPSLADGAAVADTTAKLAAAEWALRQDAIKHEPDGQWAAEATASTSYNDAQGDASWSAKQATGAPDVEKYSDDGHAWAPKTEDGGIEWLDLKYAKPVHAAEVRIRESMGSGAVVKVELFDAAGAGHIIWSGNDPTTQLNYLTLQFKPTDYLVNRVKVTLATNVIPGWNEIDAVQLVGKP